MPLQYFFWGFYVAALFFGWWGYYDGQALWYKRASGFFVFWLLIGMLGWKVFGSVIK